MHRHALAARDVADDLLAADRVAALRPEHHHIVGAAHLDAIGFRARAQHALAPPTPPGVPAPVPSADPAGRSCRAPGAATACRSRSARADRPASAGANSASTLLTASPSSSFVPLRPKRRASLSNTRLPSSTARSFSSTWIRCLILLRAREVTAKFSQSRLGLCVGVADDLDDVAVLEARAQRHHAAVDARADALVADVGVNGVGEVDRGRAFRQHLDRAARRERVDLFGVEIDLQVRQELLRVAHFLLPLEQLAQPLEVLLVALRRRRGLPCTSSARRCLLPRAGASLRCESALRTETRDR